jgi:hypothetical protein
VVRRPRGSLVPKWILPLVYAGFAIFTRDAACKCPRLFLPVLGFLIHVCAGFFVQDPVARYARDFLLLNLAIIPSAVSSALLTFSTTVLNPKPSL